MPSGFWFSFDDKGQGGTSEVMMSLDELFHGPVPTADTNFVSPPLVEMIGSVTDVLPWGFIGVGYSANQDRDPIDVSDNYAIVFYTRGDGGQYRVKLESEAVTDNDYHGALFTAPADWEFSCIPFSELEQEGWGAPVVWTGTDVHTISFVTTSQPLDSVDLVVDRIAFIPGDITSVESISPDVTAIGIRNAPNPFARNTEIVFTILTRTPVTLGIFDVSGRQVRSLINDRIYGGGEWRISWNGNDDYGRPAGAGIYICHLQTDSHKADRKVVLLR